MDTDSVFGKLDTTTRQLALQALLVPQFAIYLESMKKELETDMLSMDATADSFIVRYQKLATKRDFLTELLSTITKQRNKLGEQI